MGLTISWELQKLLLGLIYSFSRCLESTNMPGLWEHSTSISQLSYILASGNGFDREISIWPICWMPRGSGSCWYIFIYSLGLLLKFSFSWVYAYYSWSIIDKQLTHITSYFFLLWSGLINTKLKKICLVNMSMLTQLYVMCSQLAGNGKWSLDYIYL